MAIFQSEEAKRLEAARAALADALQALHRAQEAPGAEAEIEAATRELVSANAAQALAQGPAATRKFVGRALQGYHLANWAADISGASPEERAALRRNAVLAASRSNLDQRLIGEIKGFLMRRRSDAPRVQIEEALLEARRVADATLSHSGTDVKALLESVSEARADFAGLGAGDV